MDDELDDELDDDDDDDDDGGLGFCFGAFGGSFMPVVVIVALVDAWTAAAAAGTMMFCGGCRLRPLSGEDGGTLST